MAPRPLAGDLCIGPFLAGLGALLLPLSAHALSPGKDLQLNVHNVYTMEDGLPQNAASVIAQTADCYLWIGSQEGLARFDGVVFTTYDSSNTPEMTNNEIQALYGDPDGALWIGTNGGGLLRYNDGTFEVFTTEHGLTNDKISSIARDVDGNLWVGTRGGGLNRYRDGRFTALTTADGLSCDLIETLYVDRAGILWVGTWGDGLNRIQGETITVFDEADGLSGGRITTLLEDRHGVLWAGTWVNGLNRYSGGEFETMSTADGLGNEKVRALYEDGEGSVWVGTWGGGINRIRGDDIAHFTVDDGLSSNMIMAILEDHEGNLWFGTMGGGLNVYKNGAFSAYTTRDGLSENITSAIYEDRDGNIWIGTYGGGLNLFRDGSFQPFRGQEQLSREIVRALTQDRDGNLWIGLYLGAIRRSPDGTLEMITEGVAPFPVAVSCFYEEQDGTFWIATDGAGVVRYQDGSFTTFDSSDGLAHDKVEVIGEDPEGNLWVGTGAGINLYRNGKFVAYGSDEGLSDYRTYSLHWDRDGNFWIGTFGGGLYLFRDGVFHPIRKKDGLADDVVHVVLEDDRGHFWMSSNKGVSKVLRQELLDFVEGKAERITATTYGVLDGLKSAECNGGFKPAGIRSSTGALWFPTVQGAVTVDPSQTTTNTIPPPVHIETVVVDERDVDPRTPARLTPGTRKLEFHFTAPSFVAPGKVRFRYRLEGFEEQWVEAGTRRSAYYTALPPGDYEFQVTACNNDGVWAEEGSAFRFSIQPHFYETITFYLSCGLAGLLLIVGVFQLRVRQIQTRQRELEQLVQERTTALKTANSELERLSSTDGLTGIANRRYFDEAFAREWRRCQRNRQTLSAILFDIDYFKSFNDTYGHLRGDDCLRRIATPVRDSFRRGGDMVARYGGEEFVVLLPDTTLGNALKLAEKLRADVEALQLRHEGSTIADHVTISAGVAATVPGPESERAALLDSADKALYRAKAEGRNRVLVAENV